MKSRIPVKGAVLNTKLPNILLHRMTMDLQTQIVSLLFMTMMIPSFLLLHISFRASRISYFINLQHQSVSTFNQGLGEIYRINHKPFLQMNFVKVVLELVVW
jgi:hypothetical protein